MHDTHSSRNVRIPIRLALLALVACGGHAAGQGHGPVPVAVEPAVERDVPPAIRLVGSVRAERSAVVAGEVPGVIVSFTAEEGQFLHAGEPIAALDAEPPRLRRDEALGSLEGLRQKLVELETGEREEELRRLAAYVDELSAVLSKWEGERKRVLDLYALGQGNEKERRDTEMEYLAGQRRLAQAQAALDKAKNGPRKEELARARQDVVAQEARVRLLERELEKSQIRAPFDGFVTAKRTEIGEWLAEGGPVVEMVAIEIVRIRADVPESAVAYCTVGAPVSVFVEALNRNITATVSRVIPRASPTGQTFPIEADVPNADHTLLPGMFVWMTAPSGAPGKRIMVNKDAIVTRGGLKQIFVVRAGDGGAQMALPLTVSTGLELGSEIEVSGADLRAGEPVVCRANERLYAPTEVIPRPLSTADAPSRGADAPAPKGAPRGEPGHK